LVAALTDASQHLSAPVVDVALAVEAKAQKYAQILRLARVVEALEDLKQRFSVE